MGTFMVPNNMGEAHSPALRACDRAALVCTQLNSACCQRRVAPIALLTGNHPLHRLLWERYQGMVWERARWHGTNCLRKRANGSPGWIFICQLLTQCHSSVWFTRENAASETYAKNIIYLMTAAGLVTGMYCLFSMVKRNWTGQTYISGSGSQRLWWLADSTVHTLLVHTESMQWSCCCWGQCSCYFQTGHNVPRSSQDTVSVSGNSDHKNNYDLAFYTLFIIKYLQFTSSYMSKAMWILLLVQDLGNFAYGNTWIFFR